MRIPIVGSMLLLLCITSTGMDVSARGCRPTCVRCVRENQCNIESSRFLTWRQRACVSICKCMCVCVRKYGPIAYRNIHVLSSKACVQRSIVRAFRTV